MSYHFWETYFLKMGIQYHSQMFQNIGQVIFKTTSSINCWKENLNTCSSFSWRVVPSNQDKTFNVLKRTLGCCKIQIVFKNQINLWNIFRFKDCLPYNLVSCVEYKFQFGRCLLLWWNWQVLESKVRRTYWHFPFNF